MSLASIEKVPADSTANFCMNSLTYSPITTTQRNGLTGATGMLIYNSTVQELECYSGNGWNSIGGTGTTGSFYSRTDLQTTISGVWGTTGPVTVSATRSGDNVDLWINGGTGSNANGTFATATTVGTFHIDVSQLPAIYNPYNGDNVTAFVQVTDNGTVKVGSAIFAATSTISIGTPGTFAGSGNTGFNWFSVPYIGVAL